MRYRFVYKYITLMIIIIMIYYNLHFCPFVIFCPTRLAGLSAFPSSCSFRRFPRSWRPLFDFIVRLLVWLSRPGFDIYNNLCINLHSNTTPPCLNHSTRCSISLHSNTQNHLPTPKRMKPFTGKVWLAQMIIRGCVIYSGSSDPRLPRESKKSWRSSVEKYGRCLQPGKRIDLLVFEIIKYFHSHSDSNITLDYLSEKLGRSRWLRNRKEEDIRFDQPVRQLRVDQESG